LSGRQARLEKARIYTEITGSTEDTEDTEKKREDGGMNPTLQRKMLGVVFTEY